MANLYRKPDAMRTIERAGAAIVPRGALRPEPMRGKTVGLANICDGNLS